MVYQPNHGPGGNTSYHDGHGGPNEAYFDKDPETDSPFEHYKDDQYDKKDDNPLSGDYAKNQEGEQEKEEKHESTLIDNIKREEEKSKGNEAGNVPKKAADEIMHKQASFKNSPGKDVKKKNKAHKSIEEAIKDASKDKKEAFVLE